MPVDQAHTGRQVALVEARLDARSGAHVEQYLLGAVGAQVRRDEPQGGQARDRRDPLDERFALDRGGWTRKEHDRDPRVRRRRLRRAGPGNEEGKREDPGKDRPLHAAPL